MQCDDVGELEEWGRKLQLIIQRLIVHEGFLVVSDPRRKKERKKEQFKKTKRKGNTREKSRVEC